MGAQNHPFAKLSVQTSPQDLQPFLPQPVFVVQPYPVPGLLVNKESHETHLYGIGSCTVQAWNHE